MDDDGGPPYVVNRTITLDKEMELRIECAEGESVTLRVSAAAWL